MLQIVPANSDTVDVIVGQPVLYVSYVPRSNNRQCRFTLLIFPLSRILIFQAGVHSDRVGVHDTGVVTSCSAFGLFERFTVFNHTIKDKSRKEIK